MAVGISGVSTRIDYGNPAWLLSLSQVSIAAIVNNSTLSGIDVICSNWDNTLATRHVLFRSNEGTLQAFIESSGPKGGNVGLGLTAGQTHSVVLTWDGITLRGYRDGTVGGTTYGASSAMAATSTNAMFIGNSPHSGDTSWDGWIAELAIWAIGLTAQEVQGLAAGCSPLLVRRNALVFYAPLHQAGLYRDVAAGRDGTPGGTINSVSHPRIIYPRAPLARRFTRAVGGEGPLVGGKLIRGGILMRGRLVG